MNQWTLLEKAKRKVVDTVKATNEFVKVTSEEYEILE